MELELGLEVGIRCPQVQRKERTTPRWGTVWTRAWSVKGRHRTCVYVSIIAGGSETRLQRMGLEQNISSCELRFL